MLVLVLCGVPDEAIVADYAMTVERLRGPRATALGLPDDAQEIHEALATSRSVTAVAVAAWLAVLGHPSGDAVGPGPGVALPRSCFAGSHVAQ